MALLDFLYKKQNVEVIKREASPISYGSVASVSYDGEKNLGEIGRVYSYSMDYHALRARSWKAYIDSEVCQTVINRYVTWVIGSGLKLQAEPEKEALKSEKVKINKDFISIVESRFKVYAGSKMPDYSAEKSLHQLGKDAFINAIVGGDVLVIKRIENGILKNQIIDGEVVSTPFNFRNAFGEGIEPTTKNRIKDGVELDSRGRHVAYHVKTDVFKWERIPAYNKNGQRIAYMLYGLGYRLGDTRGIPLITAVLESMSKMERYKEATLGSAEEAAKVAYTIEHEAYSTGENPVIQSIAKASGIEKPLRGDNPKDISYKEMLNTVRATTNKQAINMPLGAKMKALESKKELYFNDFYTINIQLVCAAVGIPPEVAMMKYDSNFSASRAALKDWENTLSVVRSDSPKEFYCQTYYTWLDLQVLTGKIAAPKYLDAFLSKDEFVLAAYRQARFVGANVPHIDPVKEVAAERLKLGSAAAHLPLTTLEAATEVLNGGDSEINVEYFIKELEAAQTIKPQTQQGAA